MNSPSLTPTRFIYEAFELGEEEATLLCRYRIGERRFEERFSFPGVDPHDTRWRSPAVFEAARLVFLFAGVSYYKTSAPGVIDLGSTRISRDERDLLSLFYHHGLAEFAYHNQLDLSALEITGGLDQVATSIDYRSDRGPLIAFGGGIDSIVTVESMRSKESDCALFVMNKPFDRFPALEDAALVSALPIVRAEREIDSVLYRSAEEGFLNGHVPITGILSAVALVTALAHGRSAVVMSNERSASAPTIELGALRVNHQWSKSWEFEERFATVLSARLGDEFDYFSWLRNRSELFVAERFARLPAYHRVFRSCNRSFALDAQRRATNWCGECDKCCFIDLVLAAFMSRDELDEIFSGAEPLENEHLRHRFEVLVGVGDEPRPFECIGDLTECTTAAMLAASRTDRANNAILSGLAAAIGWSDEETNAHGLAQLAASGVDLIPERYRTRDER